MRLLLSILTSLLCVSAFPKGWQKVVMKSDITHVQPMTGLVLWPHEARRLNETYGKAIQLEFSYCLPCKVVRGCKEDGSIEYDWRWFDAILDDVASRGLVGIDAANSRYSPFVSDDGLMGLKFGLFDDSFMHEGHEGSYNERNWNAIGKGTAERQEGTSHHSAQNRFFLHTAQPGDTI